MVNLRYLSKHILYIYIFIYIYILYLWTVHTLKLVQTKNIRNNVLSSAGLFGYSRTIWEAWTRMEFYDAWSRTSIIPMATPSFSKYNVAISPIPSRKHFPIFCWDSILQKKTAASAALIGSVNPCKSCLTNLVHIPLIHNNIWLVVFRLPLWKMMEWKSVGVTIPKKNGKIKNVPNHQPDIG